MTATDATELDQPNCGANLRNVSLGLKHFRYLAEHHGFVMGWLAVACGGEAESAMPSRKIELLSPATRLRGVARNEYGLLCSSRAVYLRLEDDHAQKRAKAKREWSRDSFLPSYIVSRSCDASTSSVVYARHHHPRASATPK